MKFFRSNKAKSFQERIQQEETKEGKTKPIPWSPLYVIGAVAVLFLFIFSCGSVLFFVSVGDLNDEGPEPTPKARNAREFDYRGVDFADQGNFQRAIEDFTEAIRLKPDFSTAHYNRGVTYNKLERYQEAVIDFTNVITLNPAHQGAYVNRAVAYILLNLDSESEADILRAIALGVDEVELRARIEGARLSRNSSSE